MSEPEKATMTDHAVVIAGGGPTGMMLGAELRLAGIDVAIVEQRSGHELEGPRSRGLHARTIEVLDQRGVADRFLAEGRAMQVQSFGMIPLDISDFPTRHNYGLALRQQDFERILGGWADELGVRFHRGCSVTGFTQDDSGVKVHLDDGRALRADYLVGCDGGRSLVRRSAGIEFAGCDASVSHRPRHLVRHAGAHRELGDRLGSPLALEGLRRESPRTDTRQGGSSDP